MYDLVTNKSKDMQLLAKELGFKDIFLVSDKSTGEIALITKAQDYKKEVQKARKKSSIIIALGNTRDNRKIVEACPDILLSPHSGSTKDFMKERASGLDQIICKIAAKNKVTIAIDFSEILNASSNQRAEILGRIMQNIKLCRKYKVKMLIASFASSLLELRAAKDLEAFAQSIGMTGAEAKNSLKTIEEIAKRNKFKASKSYVAEGITVVE